MRFSPVTIVLCTSQPQLVWLPWGRRKTAMDLILSLVPGGG